MAEPGSKSRTLLGLLYGAALLIWLDQGAELVVSLLPADADVIQWRFGAYGLVVSRVTTVLIADSLFVVAAMLLGHRRVLRMWAALHLIAVLPLLGGLALFGLDSLELGHGARPAARATLLLATVKAATMVVLTVVYCLWAGIGAWRATAPSAAVRRDGPEYPMLFANRPGDAGPGR